MWVYKGNGRRVRWFTVRCNSEGACCRWTRPSISTTLSIGGHPGRSNFIGMSVGTCWEEAVSSNPKWKPNVSMPPDLNTDQKREEEGGLQREMPVKLLAKSDTISHTCSRVWGSMVKSSCPCDRASACREICREKIRGRSG